MAYRVTISGSIRDRGQDIPVTARNIDIGDAGTTRQEASDILMDRITIDNILNLPSGTYSFANLSIVLARL
jgi:hypothetical protein